jgi:uncharacterized protein YgiM (DUF1202 family)
MNTSRAIRTIVGLVVVMALAGLVMNWVGDYRSASTKGSAPETSAQSSESTKSGDSDTAPSGGTSGDQKPASETAPENPPAAKTVLVVDVDGLNFRAEPNADSPAIRGLRKGEKVGLLEDQGHWYKVVDKNGDTGYITSNASYTTRVK